MNRAPTVPRTADSLPCASVPAAVSRASRPWAARRVRAALVAIAAALATGLAHAQGVTVTPTSPAAASAPAPDAAVPFPERTIRLGNGLVGRALSFSSANPRSYEDIVARRPMPTVTLHAKLFEPAGTARLPAVIVVPGSGGVNPSMLAHANALTDAGIAVLLLDPFGGRGVRDTIGDQGQFPFAASTWDVFAAMVALEREPRIDVARVGAIGYSRGGLSVLQAAIRPLADVALGPGRQLRAVLAGWPWCGYQFADPQTAPTAVRFVVADRDNWVSPLQCLAYYNAMRPRNPAVTFRLVRDASHGFGYGTPVREIPQAIHALNAPVIHFDARGVAKDPWSGEAMPGADDASITAMARPFLGRGVRAGTQGDQMADFVRDMTGFFITQLKL